MAMIIGMMVTAVGVTLLYKMLKGSIWSPTNSMKVGSESKGQIIEIDEYEIVDETQNRASKGHKVKIDDGGNQELAHTTSKDCISDFI